MRHPQLINVKQKKVPTVYNEKRAQYQKPSIYTHNTDGWLLKHLSIVFSHCQACLHKESLYQIHTYHACLPTGLLRGVLNALGENLEDCSSDVRGSSFGQLCNIDIPVAQSLPGLSVLNLCSCCCCRVFLGFCFGVIFCTLPIFLGENLGHFCFFECNFD